MNKAFKDKQEWLKAVMASDLGAATKVFAFGVFTHMYGNKTEAYPGTEALEETTGQHRSKFPTYRKALFAAGFLTGEVIKGRNYTYRLSYMYLEGTSTCTGKGQVMYPEGTTHVPERDTNTTSNTPMKTTREDNKVTTTADAPVVPVSSNYEVKEGYEYMGTMNQEDFEGFSNFRETLSLDYLANSKGVAVFDSLSNVGSRDAAESQVETDSPAVEGVSEVKRFLTPGEKKDFERAVRVHRVTDAQAKEALAIVQGIGGPLDIYEATTDALVSIGAVVREAVEVW